MSYYLYEGIQGLMKKFLFFLIILLILAGAGLYFGWAQAKVPPGSYGVLRTKTHGTDPDIIRDGEFRWIWYKLIPTNAELLVFTPRRINRPFNFIGTLPSGRHYAALAGINTDFSWEVKGSFSFSVKPESLPSLAEKENLADEGAFTALEDRFAGSIEDFITRYLYSLAEDEPEMENVFDSRSFSELGAGLEAAFPQAFPQIEGFECTIGTAAPPDFELYRAVKALSEDYMSRIKQVLSNDVLKEAEARVNQRIRLDELAQYGEILTKYPILLQYLALEKGIAPAAAP
ncbi:MAG: hypothetical protein LBH43_11650 [Treponema sp.]|nr:hypothetical protein [Treponema sp.]